MEVDMTKCVSVVWVATFVLAFQSVSRGDSWPNPGARIFASEDGIVGLKVVPEKDYRKKRHPVATGLVFSLNERDGSENILWKQGLVNIPARALILRSYGTLLAVVTLDTYAHMGYEHSLVIYRKDGKLVKDLQLEDLLTKEEIAHQVTRSTSSRWWRMQATFDLIHDPKNPKLRISFDWGKVVLVELHTGKIVSPEQDKQEKKVKTETSVSPENTSNILSPPFYQTQDLTQVKWIENCLLSFDAIKPGLTRNHIKNIFPMDGGLQFVSPVRFVHPECAYLKIDVDFEFKRDVTDQGRAIVGKDDKVTNVSKPYIERPHMD
jgi:hypothetical protein